MSRHCNSTLKSNELDGISHSASRTLMRDVKNTFSDYHSFSLVHILLASILSSVTDPMNLILTTKARGGKRRHRILAGDLMHDGRFEKPFD